MNKKLQMISVCLISMKNTEVLFFLGLMYVFSVLPPLFLSSTERRSSLLDYCELSNRFPRDQWDSALQFFLNKQEE